MTFPSSPSSRVIFAPPDTKFNFPPSGAGRINNVGTMATKQTRRERVLWEKRRQSGKAEVTRESNEGNAKVGGRGRDPVD